MPTLRSLTRRTSIWNPGSDPRSTIRYVDVSAVSRERLEIGAVEPIQAELAPSRARKIIETGDTIVATIRPGLKRVAKVQAEFHRQIASTAFCVLRPDLEQIDPDYLFFVASSDEFIAAVAEHQAGASYPAVRDEDIINREIVIPSLAEQRRVASVLTLVRTALLHQIDLIDAANDLKACAMRELFTRGLRGDEQKETEVGPTPASWDVEMIGEHFSLSSGGTPSRVNPKYWINGTIPWVKTGEVDYRLIVRTQECITNEGLRRSAAKLLPPGTLLMAMYGQGKTRGKVAILGIAACCNQACAAFHPRDAAVTVRFLYHYLAYSYDALRRYSHGGQQQNLNMDIVKAFRIAYPRDAEEQCWITGILDAIDQKIDIHKKKRAVLEDLFKSLLHKLMTGEIRVTDLNLSALDQSKAIEVSA